MSESPLSSLPPTLLFQIAVPCLYVESAVWRRDGLGDEYRIPCFSEMEGKPVFADLRWGWNAQELAFQVDVEGNEHDFAPNEGNDTVQFFFDTRATHNVHRATRFCHWFVIHPLGTDNRGKSPQVHFPPIRMARELAKPPPRGSIVAEVKRRTDGYRLRGAITAEALTGYDPDEHPRLGFNYVIGNAALGWQLFTSANSLSMHSDPSLWGDLELVRNTP
jgi:hypothetical protein